MPFSDYFQDEMEYLMELGSEFVRDNPKLEPFLSPSDPDPDVRRLLEGFAFLSGRLRQKLDDEFPELTHSLMRVLWPHYLRPVPSMSILEFSPVSGAISELQKIPKGRLVESLPLGEGQIRCQFRTCFDIDLLPLTLSDASYRNTGSGGTLELDLTTLAGVAFDRIGLDHLRLYLHSDGDSSVGTVLYLWLCRYLSEFDIVAHVAEGKPRIFSQPPEHLRVAGFGQDEALLPYPSNSFDGYRLLQEYFSLPQKFLFFDVFGLGFLSEIPWIDRVTLRFRFTRPLDDHIRVKPQNVRLFCTPIVNLFQIDADPIRLNHRQTEYRLRPHSQEQRFFEVYSVDEVSGAVSGTGELHRFVEFESFQHEHDWAEDMAGYYRLRLEPTTVGRGVETYMSFVTPGGETGLPPMETLSVKLTCTNRNLVDLLRVGQIDRSTDYSPEFVNFRNICPASPSLAPPLDARLHWRLVSNMSLNYMSLLNVDALREILATYDFRAYVDEQAKRASLARLRGIEHVTVAPEIRLKRGLPIRGLRTTMKLRERSFGAEGISGEAGMFLFATVLNEFLGLYASVNSFHELAVEGSDRKESYRWPRKDGLLPLL